MINVEIEQRDEAKHTVNMVVTQDGNQIGTIEYKAPYEDKDTRTRLWHGHIKIDETHSGNGFATEALLQGDFLLAREHPDDARIFKSKYSFTRYLRRLDEEQILEDTSVLNMHTVRFRLKRK